MEWVWWYWSSGRLHVSFSLRCEYDLLKTSDRQDPRLPWGRCQADEAIPEGTAGLLLVAGGRSREVALPLCPVGRTTWMGFAGAVAVPPPVIEVGNAETDLGKYELIPISYKHT